MGENVYFTKIVSGGQTGADRAALDFAVAHGIPHGGWCPKGSVARLSARLLGFRRPVARPAQDSIAASKKKLRDLHQRGIKEAAVRCAALCRADLS